MIKKITFLILPLVLAILFLMLSREGGSRSPRAGEVRQVRILATSDLHGRMFPWDYALRGEDPTGSLTQLASAIQAYRTPYTLLVDGGDTIQDSCAELFAWSDEVHPMVKAINALDYDVWVTGNHEYDYGLEVTKKTIADLTPTVLTGNVYDEEGVPLAQGYAIFPIGGIRVAVIGMVTPNILLWDNLFLKEGMVTDPLQETRRIIDSIEGQYDVLVGVFHMGLTNEYEVPASGVTDIVNACPELDVCVAAHQHKKVEGVEIGGVLVVENRRRAETMAVVDLSLRYDGSAWILYDRSAFIVPVGDFPADARMEKLLAPYHEKARAYSEEVVGILEGEEPLARENEIDQLPRARLEDTPLMELINRVQLHYSGASVSAAPLLTARANLYPGEIHPSDLYALYRFPYTLCTLRLTGAQLRKYLEWSYRYLNTYQPGDLTVSLAPGIHGYECDLFEGIRYEVDLSKEPGSRIRNLSFMDGTSISKREELTLAVSSFRAQEYLLRPGVVFGEGELPTLVQADVGAEIGAIPDLLLDYVRNVKGGRITADCDGNWSYTGCDWDPDLHQLAIERLAEGTLSPPSSQGGWILFATPIREEDIGF